MSSLQKPIVVVGSINTDLVVTSARLPMRGETIPGTTFRTYQGGKGANQAVAAARLGYPVCMIGQVGTDAFGSASLAALRAEGIDVSGVGEHAGESGVAVITVAGGDNTIVVVPGANAAATPEFVASRRSAIASAGMVLAQFEIPIESVLMLATICREEGVLLMLDPAPATAMPEGLLLLCDWITPNETEALACLRGSQEPQAKEPKTIAEGLLRQGAKGVALKLGASGAYLATREEGGHAVTPLPVQAVDSTAAGDTFNGAFAVGLLRGMGMVEAARYAAAAAAISVTRAGAQSSMPTAREVEELLARS